jgi:hypothetical protein
MELQRRIVVVHNNLLTHRRSKQLLPTEGPPAMVTITKSSNGPRAMTGSNRTSAHENASGFTTMLPLINSLIRRNGGKRLNPETSRFPVVPNNGYGSQSCFGAEVMRMTVYSVHYCVAQVSTDRNTPGEALTAPPTILTVGSPTHTTASSSQFTVMHVRSLYSYSMLQRPPTCLSVVAR